ncbi:hypothetical protein [Bacteroides timonensis]|uniref:hypothetical protein n=1 Tax=Bacteroides timonensis TaxID=1470345 RepID=UPI001AE0D0FD|nr:hypothetical protein [Bacteroides timonensis]
MTTIYTYTKSLVENIRKSGRYSTAGIYNMRRQQFPSLHREHQTDLSRSHP